MKALNPVALDKITFYFAYVRLCTLKQVITEVGSFLVPGPVRTNMTETHLMMLHVHTNIKGCRSCGFRQADFQIYHQESLFLAHMT